jgi:ABC-type multidrug transport system ATPase subunit
VGNETIRGISGGERKRLNIATELVTDPSLIFLDEPTTGLDSFAAQSAVQMLLNLAKNSRTVIATIHQPRSSIFSLFDMLFLISEGRTMFFGPAREAVPYFSTLGYKCPATFNPSDFFIDLLSVDQRLPILEKDSRGRIATIGDAYATRANVSALRRQTEALLTVTPGLSTSVLTPMDSTSTGTFSAAQGPASCPGSCSVVGRKRKYATSWLTQCGHLIQRSWWSMCV